MSELGALERTLGSMHSWPQAPGVPPLPVSRGTHTLRTTRVGCLFLWKQDSTTPGY